MANDKWQMAHSYVVRRTRGWKLEGTKIGVFERMILGEVLTHKVHTYIYLWSDYLGKYISLERRSGRKNETINK